MINYKELNHLLSMEQLKHREEFHTTDFWKRAAGQLVEGLQDSAIQHFRRNPACLSFFVPTYGSPGNGLSHQQAESVKHLFINSPHKQITQTNNMLNGYDSAKSDHRILVAMEKALGVEAFSNFSESAVGDPMEQFIFGERTVSRASQNYLLGLVFYYLHIKDLQLHSVIEIGGGFGSLGEILAKSDVPLKTYINFDIPPTCVYADYYLNEVFPKEYNAIKDHDWEYPVRVDELSGLYVRPNYDVAKLEGTVDLVVNYHSFQEMEPYAVKAYIDQFKIWKPKYLLLRNIREGKQLKSASKAGVITPIKTNDYLTWLKDYQLIDTNSFVFGNVTVDNFHSELMLLERKT